ncbi:MAG: bifunctional fructose-bisphosphatase/inositol-phosphate phosphatase, partial [Methanosarcinales archaeon]|nr:bifunctional fructose-bisphosphatase/inositol-phosphate phosphatase [Methanosarcinales archaeon]
MYDFLRLSKDISDAVLDSISPLVGTKAAGEVMGIGADGTKTKKIDLVAENAIVEVLKDFGEDVTILSEECGIMSIGDNPKFNIILDPIDGTFNAIHDLPVYSISIAFVDLISSSTIFGYVRCFAPDTEIYATKDGGVFYNGTRVHASSRQSLNESSIGLYSSGKGVSKIVPLYKHSHRIRCLGSAAYEMALVGCGMLDAFIDARDILRITDIAASELIVKEGGGCVSTTSGKKLDMDFLPTARTSILATGNRKLHENIMEIAMVDLSGGNNDEIC